MNKITPNRLYSNVTKDRIQQKMSYAGSDLSPRVFSAIRIITTLLLFIILLTMNKYSYIVAPTLSIIYYLLFEYLLLDIYINEKTSILESAAIEYFDILLIEYQNNNNLKKSIINTNKLLEDNQIKPYFEKVIKNINTGKTIEESLKTITNIIPSYHINNLIYSLINIQSIDNIKNQLNLIRYNENSRKITKLKLIPLKIIISCIIFTSIIIGYNLFLQLLFK